MKKEIASSLDSPSEESILLPRIKDIVGIISTVAGVFVVLLWLAGRAYATGYFSAMNIPSYHVSFSVWEYAEVSWLPLVLYVIATIVIGSVVLGIVFALINKLFSCWTHRKQEMRRKRTSKVPSSLTLPVTKMLWTAFIALIGGLLLYLVLFSLDLVNLVGQKIGRQTVLHGSNLVQIVSDSPLDLGKQATLLDNSGSNIPAPFVYDGLRLLTYNNGKYYLFRDIDPATCKPKQVYIINDDHYIQANLLPAPPSSLYCPLIAPQGTNTSPTPTNTSSAP
jgi:hypothetical protein